MKVAKPATMSIRFFSIHVDLGYGTPNTESKYLQMKGVSSLLWPDNKKLEDITHCNFRILLLRAVLAEAAGEGRKGPHPSSPK
jgi:hypothetical protein